jgi:hypothetical protein
MNLYGVYPNENRRLTGVPTRAARVGHCNEISSRDQVSDL